MALTEEQSIAFQLLQFIDMADLPAKVEGLKQKDMLIVPFTKDTVVTQSLKRHPIPPRRRERRIEALCDEVKKELLQWAATNGIRDKVIVYLKSHQIPEDYPREVRINAYLMAVVDLEIPVPPTEHAWWDKARERFAKHTFRHFRPER